MKPLRKSKGGSIFVMSKIGLMSKVLKTHVKLPTRFVAVQDLWMDSYLPKGKQKHKVRSQMYEQRVGNLDVLGRISEKWGT